MIFGNPGRYSVFFLCTADAMSITPVKVSPIPRSVSDASMGYNEDDMLDSPPTRGMPDVRALADAPEPPPDMAALKVQSLLMSWMSHSFFHFPEIIHS